MTEKDLSREIMLADTVAEWGRQVLQQSQQIAKLEHEVERLREIIKTMEDRNACCNEVPQ